ncbi:nuclear transport factor 2 family protein [Rhodococcus sp. HNM0569]|uniref:nuclear transport factor 2 family protein n=1 Tax=Rhodococcus sp. HNM0569 TaxID=2716340 RepID=UPI00146DDEB3|nr:nuclear transport factor 2 family protein [Rhodococcus sp. HNM0569]NLU84703.1 nuclear transport factor 2 family protein [Rhodococcus sp. HNM0569]
MHSERDQVIEQLAHLASALDRRDWDALGAAFTEDASGYGATGRDRIVARVRAHLGGCGPSQHLLGNHRVEIDGDHARSLTYARVHHVGAAGDGAFYECFGEYDDRWTRTPDGWRVTSRTFTVSHDLGDFAVLQPG